MTRATYSVTPLLRSLVHRPQGVVLVLRHMSSMIGEVVRALPHYERASAASGASSFVVKEKI